MATFTFYMFFVWVAAMTIACWAVEVARMFARRMAKEATSPLPSIPTSAAVAVIIPIKGLEEDTADNLRPLLHQDYPNYRLLFSVESSTDPVLPLLHQLQKASSNAKSINIIIAGIAQTRGQKIHNQLAALDQTSDQDHFLVFMDADARPKPNWIHSLVAPLAEPAIGATTGFRFYVPATTDNPQAPALPNIMVSIINASVAALLGPDWRNHVWGGSMAIRRRDFFTFGVHQAWQNAISDDYVLSFCVRRLAKKRIRFVHQCLVSSAASFSWHGFFEFASRQYRITRICAPFVWLTAFSAVLLYLVALIYTPIFWLISLLNHHPDHNLLLMFTALYIAQIIRGFYLLQGGKAALPESATQLQRAWFWYTLAYPVSILINLAALFQSAFGRTILWRGIHYHMHSRTKTTVHLSHPMTLDTLPRPAAPPPSPSHAELTTQHSTIP